MRRSLTDKLRAGHTAKIQELLQKYGAKKLSKIDKSYYPLLVKEVVKRNIHRFLFFKNLIQGLLRKLKKQSMWL